MKKYEFDNLLERLYEYFGYLRTPKDRQIEQWLKKIEHIPNEAIIFIVTDIEDNCDSIPRNLPKHFKKLYEDWKNQNPGKVIYNIENCGYCHGDGYLIYLKDEYQFCALCGHCENWRRDFGEKAAKVMTVFNIQDIGGVVYGYEIDSFGM